MRIALANHVNENVLLKGWINDWKDLENSNNFQLSIKNPIIKKVDKNILFDNQKILSREDHINLFLPKDRFQSFKNHYSRLDAVYCSGKIIQYTRSNGTQDYGIDLYLTSTVVDRFDAFLEDGYSVLKVTKKMGYPTRELLNYIRHYLIPRSHELENEIEEIGDLFPTFSGTYPEVMNILLDQRRQMEFVLPIMESALDSPSYQYRIKKIKHKNKVKAWKKTKGFGYSFA